MASTIRLWLPQVLGKQETNHMVINLFWWTRFHLADLLQREYRRCPVYVTKAAALNENVARKIF